MDFITDLPKSRDKTVIMVIVDRFTKMAHFIPLRMLPTAQITADIFFREIFRLHGLPEEIISDRGTQFASEFWQRLCSLLGIDHKLSSAHHPQTDGQTERVNGILEQFLRCYINKKQDNWTDLLPFAEFAYNNTLQQSIKQTPFFANYGLHPRSNPIVAAFSGDSTYANRAKEIQKNFVFLSEQLKIAKERYKKYADRQRQKGPELFENDYVWLKRPDLLPGNNSKLSNKKIGPFKITKKISPVSFKLELPKRIGCHPVFHISDLEPYFEREGFYIPLIANDMEKPNNNDSGEIIKGSTVRGIKYYCILYRHGKEEEVE